jgi:hypothetical protein
MAGIDWVEVFERRLEPPFKPSGQQTGYAGLPRKFQKEWEEEMIQSKTDDFPFEGFSFPRAPGPLHEMSSTDDGSGTSFTDTTPCSTFNGSAMLPADESTDVEDGDAADSAAECPVCDTECSVHMSDAHGEEVELDVRLEQSHHVWMDTTNVAERADPAQADKFVSDGVKLHSPVPTHAREQLICQFQFCEDL